MGWGAALPVECLTAGAARCIESAYVPNDMACVAVLYDLRVQPCTGDLKTAGSVILAARFWILWAWFPLVFGCVKRQTMTASPKPRVRNACLDRSVSCFTRLLAQSCLHFGTDAFPSS